MPNIVLLLQYKTDYHVYNTFSTHFSLAAAMAPSSRALLVSALPCRICLLSDAKMFASKLCKTFSMKLKNLALFKNQWGRCYKNFSEKNLDSPKTEILKRVVSDVH